MHCEIFNKEVMQNEKTKMGRYAFGWWKGDKTKTADK